MKGLKRRKDFCYTLQLIGAWNLAGKPAQYNGTTFSQDKVIVLSRQLQLRNKLTEANKLLEEISYNPISDEELNLLNQYLDQIINKANIVAETTLSATPLSLSKISASFERFAVKFNEKQRLRQLIDILPIDGKKEDSTLWGLNSYIQREFFVETPENSHFEIDEVYAHDMATSEEEFFYELIQRKSNSETFDSIEDAILYFKNNDHKTSNLVILSTSRLYGNSIISSSKNLVHPHERSDNRMGADGFINIDNVDIPIFSVYSRAKKALKGTLIFDKTKLKAIYEKNPNDLTSPIGDTNLFYSITDPTSDENLRNKILDTKPDWIMEYKEEKRIEVIGKYLQLKIFERCLIENKEKASIFIKEGIAPLEEN